MQVKALFAPPRAPVMADVAAPHPLTGEMLLPMD